MLCRDFMNASVTWCRDTDTIAKCARMMREWNVGFLPVLTEDKLLLGVVTDRDIAVRGVGEGRPETTPIREIMTANVVVCREDAKLSDAEERMSSNRKSRIVVIDKEGRCTGVISLSDLAHFDSCRRAGRVLREVTRRESESTTAAPAGYYE